MEFIFKKIFTVETKNDLPILQNIKEGDLIFGNTEDTKELYIYTLDQGWVRYCPYCDN